jgi:hypothetical protein
VYGRSAYVLPDGDDKPFNFAAQVSLRRNLFLAYSKTGSGYGTHRSRGA